MHNFLRKFEMTQNSNCSISRSFKLESITCQNFQMTYFFELENSSRLRRKWPELSVFQNCRKHISSPISVTNIDVAVTEPAARSAVSI